MCGLAGYIDFGNSSTLAILKEMTNTLIRRGPDDSGFEFVHTNNAHIGLGFRRLSIIDLSAGGHQPMVNTETGDIMVFNGEIYNYQTIRIELEEKGLKFTSQSDTEVVLKAYQQWGIRCIDKFIGMFVIVIYNPSHHKVHIFRDRAGVKPLFYYWDGTIFLFASELKAFHKHPNYKKKINFNALELYFHHGYIPAPYSIFENTHKLSPGYRLEFDLHKKQFNLFSYWNILKIFNKQKLDISFDEASEKLEEILIDSFKLRMVADVPVGLFLSGGYDSSCVAALLSKNVSAPLKTFTIGFENERYNESHFARTVANHLGTDHTEYLMKQQDALDLIPMLPDIYDEPLADGGAIPNVLVSLLASKHVKVVLSADGGDEIFAGYMKHQYAKKQFDRYFMWPSLLKRAIVKGINIIDYYRTKPLHYTDRLSRFQHFMDAKDVSILFQRLNQVFTENETRMLLKNKTKNLYNHFMNDHLLNDRNDELDRVIAMDFQTYLPGDILTKVDRATSYASIEGREPLLDHRIIEFAATLPSDFKLRNGEGKAILKHIVHKYIPKKIMDRPKMGFGLPVDEWGKNELKPLFDDCFHPSFLKKQNIFSMKKVLRLYQEYQSGNNLSFEKVYHIFIFQQWYKKWM
jgi:asparagine synthase (glutamine-hydrolysing)